MRVLIMIALFSLLLLADGEDIYKKKCASCHKGFVPMGELKENFIKYHNTKLNLKAPTINQLSLRLKQKIGDPKGDVDIQLMEVQEFVKECMRNPDKQKMVCMAAVIDAFETAPLMKGKISEHELEEVVAYIYDFDKTSSKEHASKNVSFDKALKQAKTENKLLLIKGSSEYCHFCKKMDSEVFSEKEIKDVLEKDFITVKIDVYKEKLPFGLTAKVTPIFYFINAEGKVLKEVPGSWNKDDFLEILKNIKKGVKK